MVRALANQLDDEIGSEKGTLFETLVLHEIKTYSDYFQQRWQIHYWGTPSENEVDFIISKGRVSIGIGVKSAKKWDKKFNTGLETLIEAGKIKAAYGVHLGSERPKSGSVTVLPFRRFISLMCSGKTFFEASKQILIELTRFICVFESLILISLVAAEFEDTN